MNESLMNLIEELDEAAKKGIRLSKYQVLCALRITSVQAELSSKLDAGYGLQDAVRVYYSSNPNWIEVLFRLSLPASMPSIEKKSILVTYEIESEKLISISNEFTEPCEMIPEQETLLPFVLEVPSTTERVSIPDDDPNWIELTEKRDTYMSQIVKEGSDDVSTSECTNSQTCRGTASETQYSSQVPTTNNGRDNDAHPDYRIDHRSDCRTDVCSDRRND